MTTIPRGFKRWVMGVGERLRGGARDERGAVAVFFAVAIVVLAPLALGVVDIYMTSSQRSRLQDALDAAALYTARSGATDADEIQAIGLRALLANLSDADEARLVDTNFELSDSTVVASAEMSSRSLVSDLWNHGNMTVSTNVVRASSNLEVALVLDVTLSMQNDVDDLKTAATDLVDLIVQDVQTPYYSKLAIVPYSNAVNVGTTYIDGVRGAIKAPAITGATKAKPVVITSAGHGLSNGDLVKISGVTGMTELNGNTYKVAGKTTNTFNLQTTGGSNVDGKNYKAYVSGGKADCFKYGCKYYTFTAYNNSSQTFTAASECVTERIGTYKYAETAPSTAPIGFHYARTDNECPSSAIEPLSIDKTALKAVIDGLEVTGTTAGHLGVAWGWYMISPNFGYLWPSESRPAAYGTEELLKVVVLMTDGEFNTAYCNGVVASDTPYVQSQDKAKCGPSNDSSTDQAEALCTNMKAQAIIVYTVGFRITSGSTAANLLAHCATDSKHQYLPSSGQDLQDAFQAIGQDINSLRLSH